MPRSRKAQEVSVVSSPKATRQNTASTSNPSSTEPLANVQTTKRRAVHLDVKTRKSSSCRPSTSNHQISDLSEEEYLSDEAEDQSSRIRKSNWIQGNDKPAASNKTLKSRPNKSAAKSKYLEPSESSDSESEEDSDADSNYEEPLPKKKKLTKKGKTLRKECEEEDDSGEEDGSSQKTKKKKLDKSEEKRTRAPSPPVERTEHQRKVALKTLKKIYEETDRPTLAMKKQIAEVLLIPKRNINQFFNHRRKKEQNQGKYVKANKEIRKKLEEEFKINPNPTTERKREIAEANSLELNTVSCWFVHKKIKLKNKADPKKWEELKEKKRISERERYMRKKAESSEPPKLIFFNEDQKEFMREKFEECYYPTREQCEVWGQQLKLTGSQVYNFIKRERDASKAGVRDHQIMKKREYRQGGPRKQDCLVPSGHSPLPVEDALPIIEKVLEENPDYVETEDGVLMNQINWPKNKINNYIRQILRQKRKLTGQKVKVLKEEFQKYQFCSCSKIKDLSETLESRRVSIYNWFCKQRQRILETYLDEKQEVDSLPSEIKVLEIEYLKNNVVESTEVAEQIGGVKIALGYFRMRRLLDRKRGKKVPEEKDVPKLKRVKKRQQNKKPSKKQAITQEESSDDSDDPNDSDDSDVAYDADDMDMHKSGSEELDSEESFTDSDEWDSDGDDEVDEVVKREPKEEPEDE